MREVIEHAQGIGCAEPHLLKPAAKDLDIPQPHVAVVLTFGAISKGAVEADHGKGFFYSGEVCPHFLMEASCVVTVQERLGSVLDLIEKRLRGGALMHVISRKRRHGVGASLYGDIGFQDMPLKESCAARRNVGRGHSVKEVSRIGGAKDGQGGV